MDGRRRTLASEGPLGNALPASQTNGGVAGPSSIPLPMSTMKKAPQRVFSGSRMSMAPSQPSARLSVMPGPGLIGHELRQSTSQEALRRSTMLSGQASGNRGDAGVYRRVSQATRNPPASVRRNSMYHAAGRQSIAPGSLVHSVVRDPRPIRDKNFITSCVQNLSDYLIATHCPVAITSKTFSVLSTKDIQAIFRFLVNDFVDPQIWGKKFEDDAIQILKDLRYPALETCGKTALAQPGGSMVWGGVLAMLNWLVELNRAQDRWDDPLTVTDPLRMPAKDWPLDHPGLEERLLWDFSRRTYSEWFEGGAEGFPEAEAELEEVYDRLAQASFDECEKLETVVQKRNVELQQLQAQEPPLKKLEEEYIQLMSDKTKFVAFIDLHRQKADKTKNGNDRARLAILDQDADKQLDTVRAELKQVETSVAAQNISPEEATRMNNERDTLKSTLEELRNKVTDGSSAAYDQELNVTRSIDRFEQLLVDYTALAHQIGVINPGTEGPGPRLGPDGVDYNIDIDFGLEDMNEIQASGKRLRSVIWPSLQAFGERFRKQELESGNQMIELEDSHDRIGQDVEKQRFAMEHLELKVKSTTEQAEGAKTHVQAETAEANQAVAKLEGEIAAMNAQTQGGVMKAEAKLRASRVEFSELRDKTALLQSAVAAQLTSHIGMIIDAKEHTGNSLRGLRSFAEAQ